MLIVQSNGFHYDIFTHAFKKITEDTYLLKKI
jgi:hypothetical protein